MNKFCVYLHKDLEGIVRYVGEGTLQRAYTFIRSDQPKYTACFKAFKPIVEIVEENLSKEQAEALEQKLRLLHEATIINNKYASKKVKNIDYSLISQYLKFDKTSSTLLRWIKVNPSAYNRVKIGDEAGSLHSEGYLYTMILGVSYAQHRLIWVLFNKTIPLDKRVDHINGVRSDNNLSNLRLVSDRENSLNKRTKLPNSGYRNITELRTSTAIYGYNVRWHTIETSVRNSKLFLVRDYATFPAALNAAYQFRESLIQQGVLSSHIKEGEIPL